MIVSSSWLVTTRVAIALSSIVNRKIILQYQTLPKLYYLFGNLWHNQENLTIITIKRSLSYIFTPYLYFFILFFIGVSYALVRF